MHYQFRSGVDEVAIEQMTAPDFALRIRHGNMQVKMMGVKVPISDTISNGACTDNVEVLSAKRILSCDKHPTHEAMEPAVMLCSCTSVIIDCFKSAPCVRRVANTFIISANLG